MHGEEESTHDQYASNMYTTKDEGRNIESLQDDIIRMEKINCSQSVQELQDNDIEFEYAHDEVHMLVQDVDKQPLYLGCTKYITLSIIDKLY